MKAIFSPAEPRQQKRIEALNAAAGLLQGVAGSAESIYSVFREQIEEMGLRGGVSLLDDEKQKLTFQSIAQPGRGQVLSKLESIFGRSAKNYSIDVDQVDVYQRVIMTGEAVFAPETKKVIRQMLPFSEESFIARVLEVFGRDPGIYCPLFIRDEIVGVLNVAGSDLTEADLPVFNAFANYMSAALTNNQLIEELKEKERNYRSFFNNLPIGIYRVSPEGHLLMANPVLLAQMNLTSQYIYEDIILGETGLKPLHDRAKVMEELKRTGQLIGLETKWENHQGEKTYFKENLKGFYDEHGELLYIEGTLENITDKITTIATIQKQLDDLLLLNQIAETSARQVDVDTLLEQVTEFVAEKLSFEHFGALIWEPTEGLLRVHPSYRGLSPENLNKVFLPGEGVIGSVFETGVAQRIADVRLVAGYIDSGLEMKSELCVPIKAGNRVLGVLNAERKEVAGFSAEEGILLSTIADQLATALERAQYLGEVKNQALRLTLLNEASMTTSRILDPKELIDLIASQIINLINPDSFRITLHHELTQELEIAIAVEKGVVDPSVTGLVVPVREGGLTSLVLETGEVLQIEDLETSPLLIGFSQGRSQMKGSWAGIPLVSGRSVIGALTLQYYERKVLDKDQTQFLESLASNAAIAITNGNLFAEIQTRFALSQHLAKLSEKLNQPQTEREVIEVIGESALSLLNLEIGAVYVPSKARSIKCAWSKGVSQAFIDFTENHFTNVSALALLRNSEPVLIPEIEEFPGDAQLAESGAKEGLKSVAIWPLIYEGKMIAAVACAKHEPYLWTDDEASVLMTFARQAAISIQNARLLEAERNRRFEAEALYKTTTALTSTLDINMVLDNILVELYRVVDYYSASLQLLDDDVVRIVAVQGLHINPDQIIGLEFSATNQLFSEMQQALEPIILKDAQEDTRFEYLSKVNYVRGWIGVPLVVGEKMIGCLTIDSDQVGAFDRNHAQKAKAFANQAAIAIETASLFSQTQRRLQVLQSIHTIDQAISGNLDLSVTLDVWMEQVVNLLGVDGVRVFSYDPDSQLFDLISQRELISMRRKGTEQFYDEASVQQAITQREVIMRNSPVSKKSLAQPSTASYFVAPLITRGLIHGVLELFSVNKVQSNDEWLSLLKTLSTQAAIAIENDTLLSSLKQSNDELVSAYDRTLEGWAYALELRDRETVGHSRRVTELTLRLAKRMGISGMQLSNIRRGTLLHDIGKMGLPDNVLLKEGPLTEDELKTMQTHPRLAFEMLSSIPYLTPALDIPYYHHEKFDGTGYPHGLKGKDIPLPARIFAVVDVWDALLSDRPYRDAWTKDATLQYIKDQSGKHFDPDIVKKFLEIVE